MMKKCISLALVTLLSVFLLSLNCIAAEVTVLQNIRSGQHTGYTRLVLDAEGAGPLKIGPATADSVTIVYEQLELGRAPSAIFRKMQGNVADVTHHRQGNQSIITINFKRPNTVIKNFFMAGTTRGKSAYRLIMDFYPEGSPASGPGDLVAVVTPEPAAAVPTPAPEPEATAKPSVFAPAPVAQETEAATKEVDQPTETAAAEAAPTEDTGSESNDDEAEEALEGNGFMGRISGELGVIGSYRNDDANDDSFFLQYRDFNAATGEYDLKYEEENRYLFQADGKNIGQDDINLNFRGAWYGKIKGGITYDEIPHRFAFDVRTLYSGVGSGQLALDDGLQTTLQGTGDLATRATLLSTAFGNAASGDPELDRKKLSGNFELIALDPFSFRTEFSREKQEGSRPIFGSFGLDNASELFEPIDNETWSLKLIAEYAKKAYLLNATYYYQYFDNNEDVLLFENPFRIADAVGGPSNGQIDLAPDNHYQNVSISGSYMDLPFRSRLSANAAWGWMRQDDDLLPFTTNSALVAPIDFADPANLPVSDADVEVNTSLYNVTLNTRPLDFFRVKGNFRYYDYDNKTDKIVFSDGYVETDAFQEAGPVSTLPSSYNKTKASVDLGFDVWNRTGLNLDYAFQRTNRDNREVDKQTDHIVGGSIDTKPFHWGDFRASYHRTFTDVDDYDFDVYLQSGQDLQQLPALRKYTQADVNRDRIKLMTNVYPIQPLAFSGSFTYGRDDFHDSPFGLTDVDHYSFSIDGDYTLTDRLNLNAFYIYEKYKNEQQARGDFDDDGDGIFTTTDWRSEGEDDVHTIGGGITYAIIPQKLDFKLSYSYTEADGKIDFTLPSGSLPDFDTVDETKLHTFDTNLKYNIWQGLYATLGFLWERFDYDDINKEGFTFVPTDGAGNFNGAILSDTLFDDYNAYLIYTKLSYKF